MTQILTLLRTNFWKSTKQPALMMNKWINSSLLQATYPPDHTTRCVKLKNIATSNWVRKTCKTSESLSKFALITLSYSDQQRNSLETMSWVQWASLPSKRIPRSHTISSSSWTVSSCSTMVVKMITSGSVSSFSTHSWVATRLSQVAKELSICSSITKTKVEIQRSLLQSVYLQARKRSRFNLKPIMHQVKLAMQIWPTRGFWQIQIGKEAMMKKVKRSRLLE